MLEIDDMHVPCRIQEIVNKTFSTDPSGPKTRNGPARTRIEMASNCAVSRADPFGVLGPKGSVQKVLFEKIVDRIYDISCKSFSAVTDLPVPSLPPFCLFSPGQAGQFPNKSFKASHSIYKCKLQDIEFLLAGDLILEILETAF